MTLKIKRTTKARLNEVAAQKGLSEGSPFLITDEKRMAVGLSDSTYESFAKVSELPPNAVVLRLGSNLNVVSGTYYKIADFTTVGVVGTYIVDVSLGGAYDTSATVYWAGRLGAVIAIHSVNTNVYNQSPNEIITFQGSFHHRVVNPPTFYIASDQSQAAYGNLSLFMSVPFNGTIQNLAVSAKRLM